MNFTDKWYVSPAMLQHIAPQLDSLIEETVKRITHQPFPGPLFLLEDADNLTFKALRIIVQRHLPNVPMSSAVPDADGEDGAPYITIDATAMFDADEKPTIRVRGADWPTAEMPLYCDAESWPHAIVYPMFDWTRQQVATYLVVNGVIAMTQVNVRA